MKGLIKNWLNRIIRSKNEFLLHRFLAKQPKIKIMVGSGDRYGVNKNNKWLLTDIKTLDLTKENDWQRLLKKFKVDNILAEHVWEHLTEIDTKLANQNCYKYLKENGVLRLAVPDGFHPHNDYINYVKPGGHGDGADDHKILYTYISLKEGLEKVGFKVQLLEYWDENGNFNFKDWTDDGGHIRRSSRYDSRNKEGELNYTSLIVDAIKY